MISSFTLVLAAQALSPEWAPVAITDNEGTTLYFVNRAGIEATPDGSSAWVYMVSGSTSVRIHFEYDCDRQPLPSFGDEPRVPNGGVGSDQATIALAEYNEVRLLGW